ncbi:hypothetical protein SAMN05216359_101123 [Roseateles sp. YR242]|uniref:sensor histidine kinase n=1 Tax=Roseateles sp. YR242 TaxID=1855305 RepID=UPI0008D2D541|nr:sensor histidine kinase [Roseateles sp. YR242]SEK23647.1 hypothetical protein SAMN05216359_101123 [Roseateles sp. YR242]
MQAILYWLMDGLARWVMHCSSSRVAWHQSLLSGLAIMALVTASASTPASATASASATATATATAGAHAGEERRQDFVQTFWSTKAGAPAEIVDMVQGPGGALWMASADGLIRFDGNRFERINLYPDGDTAPQNLSSVLVTPDMDVWVAFRGGGVALYRPGARSVTHFGGTAGLPDIRVVKLRFFAGSIWAASMQGLYRFDPQVDQTRWHLVAHAQGLPASVARLELDRHGALLVQGRRDRQWWRLRQPDGRAEAIPGIGAGETLAQDASGAWWLLQDAQRLALRRPDGTRAQWRLDSPINGDTLVDRRGGLWGLSLNGTVFHVPALGSAASGQRLSMEDFPIGRALGDAVPFSVLEDRLGQIWVGSTSGLIRFALPTAHRAAPYGVGGGGALVPAAAGGVWATRTGAPVTRWTTDGGTAAMPLSAADMANLGASLLVDRQGELWLGGFGAAWHQAALTPGSSHSPGSALRAVSLPPEAQRRHVQALADLPDGSMWMSIGGQGVWRQGPNGWTRSTDPGLQGNALVMTPTRTGIAVGFAEQGVAVITSEGVRVLPPADLPRGRILAIHERGPHLWIAGDGGVSLWREGAMHRLRTTGDFQLGMVTGVAEAPNGDLWLNEVKGLVLVPHAEIERLRQAPDSPLHPLRFGSFDGISGTLNPFRQFPSLAMDGQGHLWISRGYNLFWVDPAELARMRPAMLPSVVELMDETGPRHQRDGRALVTSGALVKVEFSAPELARADSLRFRALLTGRDATWRDIGNSRQVAYSGLQPGRYELLLQAAGLRQGWDEVKTQTLVVIEVPRRWYQTWWFRVLVGLLAGVLLALLYRHRLRLEVGRAQRRLSARLNIQLGERERMAKVLHDNLLQGTLGVGLKVSAGIRRLPLGDPVRTRLEQALLDVERIVQDTRDHLNALRGLDGGLLLGAAILQALEARGDVDAGLVDVDESAPARELRPGVAAEMRNIAVEALRQVLQLAPQRPGPLRVKLFISYDKAGLWVRVRDFGEVAADASGISRLRESAALLGADIDWRRGDSGTEVAVFLKASLAYPS